MKFSTVTKVHNIPLPNRARGITISMVGRRTKNSLPVFIHILLFTFFASYLAGELCGRAVNGELA